MSNYHNHDADDDELDGYMKIDRYNEGLIDAIAGNYTNILGALGQYSKSEGLLKTP